MFDLIDTDTHNPFCRAVLTPEGTLLCPCTVEVVILRSCIMLYSDFLMLAFYIYPFWISSISYLLRSINVEKKDWRGAL